MTRLLATLVLLILMMAVDDITGGDALAVEEKDPQAADGPVFSNDHLDAAYETLFMSRTSRAYSEIIPNLATRTKRKLVEQFPKSEFQINEIVDEVALSLVERQGELDQRIARRWAEQFSKEELREISAFYASPTGAKLAKNRGELIDGGLKDARDWSALIADELVWKVQEKLKAAGILIR